MDVVILAAILNVIVDTVGMIFLALTLIVFNVLPNASNQVSLSNA